MLYISVHIICVYFMYILHPFIIYMDMWGDEGKGVPSAPFQTGLCIIFLVFILFLFEINKKKG